MEQSSIDALEISCLGCLSMKPQLFEETYLTEEHFNSPQNKLMFKLFLDSYKRYKNIDMTLIMNDHENILKDKKTWFIDYFVAISSSEPSASVFQYYQEKLVNEVKKKLMLKEIEKFQKKTINDQELIEVLSDIQSQSFDKNQKLFTADYIYNAITREDKQIHLRFEALNKTIQLSEHDFLVIGSRPGCGKTGFALNLLEDISQNYNCLYFNMEMSEQQVLRRLVSINCKIPIKYLNDPQSDFQKGKIKEATVEVATRKLQVITGSQTMPMIKNTIIKEQKNGHTVVFLDYVGLIHSKTKQQSIYERITEIAKDLRMLSMTYECTIVCIAQINRSGDNKAPLLSELKDSGELEQSAVNVILLHNENYYKSEDKLVEELQCIVAKNRNGRTGIIKIDYDQYTQRIEEQQSWK